MELKLKQLINKSPLSKLTFDDLPMSLFINEGQSSDEVFHYEVITDSDSFFEIEILIKSGKIKSILLINCNKNDIEYVDMLPIDLNRVVSGNPILDLAMFDIPINDNYFKRFHRENGFKLLMAENGVEIRLDMLITPLKYIDVGESCFLGFSEENILQSFIVIWSSKMHKEYFEQSISPR